MKVSFDMSKHYDLFYIATQIVKMGKGEIQSMPLRDIQTAQSELQRIERTCEEVKS